MSRRARRLGLAAVAGVAALVIAIVVAANWAIGTQHGAEWAFERLGATLPGKLKVGRLTGSVRHKLVVYDVRYESEAMILTIRRLAIDWNLRPLVHQRIDIRNLDGEGVYALMLPGPARPAPDSTAPELPDLDLPMDFMVRHGTLRDVLVHQQGGDTTVALDTVRVTSAAFRDTLSVGALSVRSHGFDLDLRGRGRPSGRYDSDFTGHWVVHTRGGADVVGGGRAYGNLDTLRIEQRIDTPFRAELDGFVAHPLRGPRFDARVTFTDVEPNRIDPAWPATHATGSARVAGQPLSFTSAGTVRAAFGRNLYQAVFALARDQDRVRLQRVEITEPRQSGRIVARGLVVMAPQGARMDLNGSWSGIALPNRKGGGGGATRGGAPQIRSSKGTFTLGGTTNQYRLTARGGLALLDMPETPWQIAATGDARGLRAQSIRGGLLGGSVAGSGSVTWATQPMGWTLDLSARGIDPSKRWPDWPGQLAVDASSRGVMNPSGLSANVNLKTLSGTLREHPVSGRADLRIAPGAYDIRTLDLLWGPDSLSARGHVGPRWDLAATLAAPDLSVAVPEATGALRMSVQLSGSASSPRVQGTARADTLRWRQFGAQSLTADADLHDGPGGKLDVRLTNGRMGDRLYPRGSFTINGGPHDHTLQASLSGGADSATIAGRGAFANGRWTGHLTSGDIASADMGVWTLAGPATLAASASDVRAENVCLTSAGAKACGDVSWSRTGPWSARADLDSVPLAMLREWIPPGVVLDGRVNGAGAFHGTAGGPPLGEARLTIGPGEIVFPRGQTETRAPFDPATIDVRGDASGMTVAGGVTLPQDGDVKGELRMGQGTSPTRSVSGTAEAHLRDLRLIEVFVPDLTRTQGQLQASLGLSGTAAHPVWRGNATVTGGGAELPRLGITLQNAQLTATESDNGRLRIEGSMSSGPGRVDVAGEATMAPDGAPAANLTIKGQQFRAIGTRELEADVSPDLRVRIHADSLRVEGQVEVPRAEVRQISSTKKQQLIRPSEDVVVIGSEERRRGMHVTANVKVTMGDNVHVLAGGLDAKTKGSVIVMDAPGAQTTASGELHLENGRYHAYGQQLTIERGRLLFVGGRITNPGLDVRASRHARDGVTAGLEVRGTLEKPLFSTFSDPQMSDRDALAYVVMGHKLETESRSQQGIVTDAANTLGVSGGSLLAGQVANQLGIDEASVETTSGTLNQASLMLGQYLSPRMYVNYGIGLADAVSRLRIEYYLNRKWTLQAETGNETSAGILYTVER